MHNTFDRCVRRPRAHVVRALVCAGMVLGPATATAQKAHRVATHRVTTRTAVRAAPEPKPTVAPLKTFSESAAALRDSIVALARAQVGRRYVWGGEQPDSGLDCSGLVRFVMSHFDLKLPRTAAQQAFTGERVATDVDRLRPGDLLTFGRGKRITHIGIYVGDGKMVHASTAAGRVIEVPLLRAPSRLIKPWRGARRLVVSIDSAKTDSAKKETSG